MQLILNIYDENNRVIDKQYKTEEVNILFGTIEDLIDLIDENNLNDNMELAKVIVKSMKKLKPILKQVFVGVTDEELRLTRTNELVPLFMQILKYMFTQVNGLGDGSKKLEQGGDNTPLYESFFELSVILCERFSDLNPIKIRRYPACEVFLLIKRLRVYDRKKE